MTPRLRLAPVIGFLVLAGLVVAVWMLLVGHSFVTVKIGDGATDVQLENSQTGRTVAQPNVTSTLNLPTGDYTVKYYQNDQLLSLQSYHVGPFSFGSISPQIAAAAYKSVIV